MYAVHLEPSSNASFGATHEVFARGKPFPVTDLVVGADGALYLTTGGRNTQSGLYRITWTGNPDPLAGSARSSSLDAYMRSERRELERLHAVATTPARPSHADVERTRGNLAAGEPFLRHAARIALERDARLAGPDERETLVAASIARIHRDGAAGRARVHADLAGIDLGTLVRGERLELLRVWQLLLVRGPDDPELDAAGRAALGARLLPLLARASEHERRELARVLGALDLPEAIEPLLAELGRATEQEARIHYAHCLLATRKGWTLAQRERWLDCVDDLRAHAKGGHSLAKFVDAMRTRFVEGLTDDERAALGDRAKPPAAEPAANPAPVASFVRRWQRDELLELLRAPAPANALSVGRAAFDKATCASCHRVGGAGGSTGPDLTGAGARFLKGELVESLLEPSKVVSDQYRDVQLVTTDGELLVGRIERETADAVVLRRLPPAEDLVELPLDSIEERALHPLSRMPAGLLDVLTADEVRALFAYVLGEQPAR